MAVRLRGHRSMMVMVRGRLMSKLMIRLELMRDAMSKVHSTHRQVCKCQLHQRVMSANPRARNGTGTITHGSGHPRGRRSHITSIPISPTEVQRDLIGERADLHERASATQPERPRAAAAEQIPHSRWSCH